MKLTVDHEYCVGENYTPSRGWCLTVDGANTSLEGQCVCEAYLLGVESPWNRIELRTAGTRNNLYSHRLLSW